MARDASLTAVQYFETVARRGSVTLAAAELSVSPSAVSQQIKGLEHQLGVKLFRRKGRKLALTLEGEQLFQTAATALHMLRDARANLGRESGRHQLSLRVAPSFGVRWLGPRLSGFIDLAPDYALRVDAAPDPSDFDREVMDLDIRYGTSDWHGFHAAPVLRDRVLPLASPDYLAHLTVAGEGPAARLSRARLIDSARALCQWDLWLLEQGIEVTSNVKSVLMDRSSLALQLALDGKGVALESLTLAAEEVAAGRLVPVTPEVPALCFDAYWLVCPPRHLNRRAVRQFSTWLEGAAAEHERVVEALMTRLGLAERPLDALAARGA